MLSYEKFINDLVGSSLVVGYERLENKGLKVYLGNDTFDIDRLATLVREPMNNIEIIMDKNKMNM